jgi:hypothetical protein
MLKWCHQAGREMIGVRTRFDPSSRVIQGVLTSE